MKIFVTGTILCLFFASQSSALQISVIDRLAFDNDISVMNQNLRIDETFLIEDFEDAVFIPGLSWHTVNGKLSLPALETAPPLIDSNLPSDWDGNFSLVAGHNYDYGDAVFSYDGDLAAFGIGISGNNGGVNLDIFVDDVFITNVMSLQNYYQTHSGQTRNGYLWITAENNEIFNQISFIGGDGDLIYYDHLALLQMSSSPFPIPEPSILYLALSGLFSLCAMRRLRKQVV
jgi:hypothetical protein